MIPKHELKSQILTVRRNEPRRKRYVPPHGWVNIGGSVCYLELVELCPAFEDGSGQDSKGNRRSDWSGTAAILGRQERNALHDGLSLGALSSESNGFHS